MSFNNKSTMTSSD